MNRSHRCWQISSSIAATARVGQQIGAIDRVGNSNLVKLRMLDREF
ncbi:hypothetical protein [Chamaesiphon minutus]|nr:hypothetical protein [Chamaesiphon minutus]